MLSEIKDMMGQFQGVHGLMNDESFKAFIAHPKAQEVLRDLEFREIAAQKNFAKILSYPKFAALLKDPEVAPLMAKIDLKSLGFGGF